MKIQFAMMGIFLAAGMTVPAAWSIGIKDVSLVPSATLANIPHPITIDELDNRLGLSGWHATDGIHSAMTAALSLGPVFLLHQGPNVAVLPQSLVVGSQVVILRTDGAGSPKNILLTQEMVEKLDKHLAAGNIGMAHQALAAQFDGSGSGSNGGSAGGSDGSNNGFGQVVLIIRVSALTGEGSLQDKVNGFVKSIGYSLVRMRPAVARPDGEEVMISIQVPAGREQAIAEELKKNHSNLVKIAERDIKIQPFGPPPAFKPTVKEIQAFKKTNAAKFESVEDISFGITAGPSLYILVHNGVPIEQVKAELLALMPELARYPIVFQVSGPIVALSNAAKPPKAMTGPVREFSMARKVELPDSDPLILKVSPVAQEWLDENIMNDNGARIDAGQVAVAGLSRIQALRAFAKTYITDYVGKGPEMRLSGPVSVDAREFLVNAKRINGLARSIGIEGFDYDPSSAENFTSFKKELTAIFSVLAPNGRLMRHDAKAKVLVDKDIYEISVVVFVNEKTNKFVTFFIRGAHSKPAPGQGGIDSPTSKTNAKKVAPPFEPVDPASALLLPLWDDAKITGVPKRVFVVGILMPRSASRLVGYLSKQSGIPEKSLKDSTEILVLSSKEIVTRKTKEVVAYKYRVKLVTKDGRKTLVNFTATFSFPILKLTLTPARA